MQIKDAAYTKGAVTSGDGTVIGYRQYGSGSNGVILLHGGMMGSQNFSKLAIMLSASFTVYVPDRRGRGLSGPHGADYGLEKEGEDVAAIVAETGADRLFGLSSGAIVGLHAAITLPQLKKIALYEPPLVEPGASSLDWVPKYEQELSKGKLAAAMISVIEGTDNTAVFKALPRAVLVPLINMAIKANDKKLTGDDVPMSELIRTLRYDVRLLAHSAVLLEKAYTIKGDVLLMAGGKSMKYLQEFVGSLHRILPGAEYVELSAFGHAVADNSGKPGVVAEKLMHFFGG